MITADQDDSRQGSAVARAFRLIDVLVDAGRPLPLAELAELAGMPRPSAHRMLAQLEEAGLVARDLTGKRHEIGPALRDLSARTTTALARMPQIRDVMEGVVARVRETVNLGILDGRSIRYLERVECNWPLRVHLDAGSRVPMHSTAIGKLMLALLPDPRREALMEELTLERLTPHTLTRAALDAQIPLIRQRRFAMSIEENMPGLIAVAVPVADRQGAMLAGLAVHAPTSRLDQQGAVAIVPVLREAAGRIAAIVT